MSQPWNDPNHDVMADLGDALRRWYEQYEDYDYRPFEPFYTPSEQRLIDEWNKNEIN